MDNGTVGVSNKYLPNAQIMDDWICGTKKKEGRKEGKKEESEEEGREEEGCFKTF